MSTLSTVLNICLYNLIKVISGTMFCAMKAIKIHIEVEFKECCIRMHSYCEMRIVGKKIVY